jgi:hypothetical protein
MNEWTRREVLAAGLALGITPVTHGLRIEAQGQANGHPIGDFFRAFTDDWVRHDPDQGDGRAVFFRYRTGSTRATTHAAHRGMATRSH